MKNDELFNQATAAGAMNEDHPKNVHPIGPGSSEEMGQPEESSGNVHPIGPFEGNLVKA